MKSTIWINRIEVAVLAGVILAGVSSCVHQTQLNEPYINPIDTTHFSFASMTISCAACTINRHTQIGFPFDPWSESFDSTYNSSIYRNDSLSVIPAIFSHDTLLLWDHVLYMEDSVSWQFRIVIDSSRSKFIPVSWRRDSSGQDPIFDSWSQRNCDSIFNVPFMRLQDGVLASHISSINRVGVFSDSSTYSDGEGYHDVSTSVQSIESGIYGDYIDIRLSP